MIVVAVGDFGQRRVVMIPGGGKRRGGPLSCKDLQAPKGTLPLVGIFPNQAPLLPLFQARNGTACSRE
jgi:hypothetical protein